MVPKVAGKGRSFKGAGLYYLHDKNALTSERVAFTRTLNLSTDDPEKAIRWMAYTAMHQGEIKQAAGGAAKGRKLRDPVYAYSLSWAPGETPTQEDMIAAGLETIELLGLNGHEAVLVSHKDEPHPHLHVIINRVNPETGKAAPLSNDHLKLSQWAEAYERRQGQIRCEQRVENNRRRRGEFVKDRRHTDADFHRWRKARLEADFQRREEESKALTARQRRELEELIAGRKATIEEERQALKERHKPLWADLYQKQRDERRAFEHAQRTTFGRLRYWLKNREIDRWAGSSLDRQGMLSRAFEVASKSEIMRKALADKQEAERKALSSRLRTITSDRATAVRNAFSAAIEDLKRRHREQRKEQREDHSRESQAQARAIAKGSGRTAFDFEEAAKPKAPPLSPEFDKSASSHDAMRDKAADNFEEASKGDEGKDTGKRAFSAFRDARDGKDRGGSGGRERSIKPPGDKGPKG